jgi:hypothetical protein
LTPDTLELPDSESSGEGEVPLFFDNDDDLDHALANASDISETSRTAEHDPLLRIAEEGRSAVSKIQAPIAPLAPPAAPAGAGGHLFEYIFDLLEENASLTQGAIRESTIQGAGAGIVLGACATFFLIQPEIGVMQTATRIGIAAGTTLGAFVVVASVVELRTRGIL